MSARHLLLPLAALVALGCSSASEPDRVVTTPECRDIEGNIIDCNVSTPETGGTFLLTLVSTSCDASNNVIRITSPVSRTLLTDGCNASPGTSWSITDAGGGPFPAGTALAFEIESDEVGNFPPGIRVTGTSPTFLYNFEDGGDQDFNDIVIRVEVIPAP